MDFLAIRDEGCKNVYYYNTKGEKGRILSKFPKASNRVFPESEKDAAMIWAGVDRIATEEENLWATSKQIKEKKENIEENEKDNTTKQNETNNEFVSKESLTSISLDKDITSNEQKNDDKSLVDDSLNNDDKAQLKHIMSDFEKIVEIYKKNGIKMLEITMLNNEKYCLITDDIYYISNFGTNDFGVPFAALSEKEVKNKIMDIVEKRKASGEKGVIFNNFVSFDMFVRVPKTKYLAFGDLVYANNLNNLVENREDLNTINYLLENDEKKKNVTLNTSSILSIKPISMDKYSYLIREKEFNLFIKKALKQIEKEKEREKIGKKEQN